MTSAISLVKPKARSSALDGLRGLAAFVVVIHHLMQSFFPGVYWGKDVLLHSSAEIWFGNSPLALLWAGHFAVCAFFVMSGYALSAMMTYSSLSLIPQIVRRYIRLTLPILFASLLSFISFSQGLFFNVQASKLTWSKLSLASAAHMPESYSDLIFDALLNVYTRAVDKVEYVGDVLWTMQYEMIGSLIIITLYSVIKPFLSKTHFKWFLLALMITLISTNMNYALFIVGALFFEQEKESFALPAKIAIPICVLALYLGSVPFYMTDFWFDGNPWHLMGVDPMMTTSQILHMLGAVLLVGVVLFSGIMNPLLKSFIPQFLGRVSFLLYLSHYIVICSVGSWVFLMLHLFNGPYIESVLPAFFATIITSLALAWLLTRYVDEPSVTLSKKVGTALNRILIPRRATETS